MLASLESGVNDRPLAWSCTNAVPVSVIGVAGCPEGSAPSPSGSPARRWSQRVTIHTAAPAYTTTALTFISAPPMRCWSRAAAAPRSAYQPYATPLPVGGAATAGAEAGSQAHGGPRCGRFRGSAEVRRAARLTFETTSVGVEAGQPRPALPVTPASPADGGARLEHGVRGYAAPNLMVVAPFQFRSVGPRWPADPSGPDPR
jgi:hypothetical protein